VLARGIRVGHLNNVSKAKLQGVIQLFIPSISSHQFNSNQTTINKFEKQGPNL